MNYRLVLLTLALMCLTSTAACREESASRHREPSEAHGHDESAHDDHEGEGHRHGEGAHDDHEGEGDGHGEREHDEYDGRVRLTETQMAEFGVSVATAGPGSVDLGVELPCEVRPNGDRLAHIVPRFPGIVKDVKKTIGDHVRTGDVLAVIESSDSLTPYALTTLIEGTVIEKHLTKGEAVDRDKQAFAIADLSSVWVDCSVFQKDLERVTIGKSVVVSAGADGPEARGSISYLTPVVDQPTRTATARTVLENTDGRWRPGMFVSARVLDLVPVPLAITHSALQTIGAEQVVFVAEEDHEFAPRPVTLGRMGAKEAEVVRGLKPGERYVVTNSFLLKAELGKSSAEHEH